MSSGSMKDLIKTISSCVTKATVPLPNDLVQVLQAFLDKHEIIEDSDSQRLQEELLAIYQREIHQKPNRYSFFLALLRHLRPVLKGRRLLEWWDLLHANIFDSLTEERGLANEARSILLEFLVHDEDGEDNPEAVKISRALFDRLMKLWLENCNATAAEDQAAHLVKSQIQHVLILFGRKRTKEFLSGINELFVQKKYRLQVLPLLSRFMQCQPPRLHELLQTPLFNNLLRCLTIDTSTTVVSLAISALVMFLPHIPFSMSKYLPSLFNIYSRLLFWDRQCNTELQDEASESEPEKPSDSHRGISQDDPTWEKLSYSFETDESNVPELLQYFTFLYGLYPINFMDYVRKPQRYLRHANYPGAETVNIEPLEIRQRSEPYRQLHLLHENFFHMTIESELADANRFMTIDAPDIITNCMALCIPMYAVFDDCVPTPRIQSSRQPIGPDDDIPDVPLLDREDGSSAEEYAGISTVEPPNEHNGVSRLRRKASIIGFSATGFPSPISRPHGGVDSPTLGPYSRSPAYRTSLQDMLNSQKNLRGSVYQSLASGSSYSVASSTLNQEAISTPDLHPQTLEPSSADSKITPLQPNIGDYMAALHREILLLKNDLNFERYLKQQHLSHIGQLRRKHVKEATVEAETQNLINTNRNLKNKLEEAKRSNVQVKREAEKSRSHLKKWEADLNAKLRSLRAEQKRWIAEGEVLRRDLSLAQDNCKKLKQLVVDGEARELLSKQQVESMRLTVEENDRLKLEIAAHIAKIRELEIQANEHGRTEENETSAWTKVDMLHTNLQAREAAMKEMKGYYDAQIEDLRLKLEEATRDPRRKQLKGFQNMVDSALAATRLKLSELQNENANMQKRYAKLEYQLLKLQEQTTLQQDQPLLSRDAYAARTVYHGSTTNQQFHSSMSIHRTHTMSDPDIEPVSPSTVPPPLSSSYPERLEHSRASGNPAPRMRLNSPTSPSPSGNRAERLGSNDTMLAPNRSKGSSEGHSSSEVDGSGVRRVLPQSEVRVYGRGGVQNIGKQKKEKKLLDAEGGEASGVDRKDKKKKGGGLKGIRGFV